MPNLLFVRKKVDFFFGKVEARFKPTKMPLLFLFYFKPVVGNKKPK